MLDFSGGKIFADRRDAGIQLAKLLEKDYKNKNVLVFGIPRGGVEVAYHVAKRLNGELSLIISKKLPYPGQPELACGAVAEDGSVYLSALGKRLDKSVIDGIVEDRMDEIQKYIDTYRNGEPLPEIKGRIVIIVDDGIATGSTMVPALKLCRARKAAKVIIASPVSGTRYSNEIDENADEVRVLEVPDNYYAVGQVYEDFHACTDTEVISFLE